MRGVAYYAQPIFDRLNILEKFQTVKGRNLFATTRKNTKCPQGSYLLSTANAPIRYEAGDVRVTKRAMSALRSGRCPRYETGDARVTKRVKPVTESAYDVFRLSVFPGCRRISSLAFRGICAKPHIYFKKNLPFFSRQKFLKKEPDRGLI